MSEFGLPPLKERIKIAKKLESENKVAGDPYCDNLGCTRMSGLCIGYHCPYCGGPCGPQGHSCSQRQYAESSETVATKVMPHAS